MGNNYKQNKTITHISWKSGPIQGLFRVQDITCASDSNIDELG